MSQWLRGLGRGVRSSVALEGVEVGAVLGDEDYEFWSRLPQSRTLGPRLCELWNRYFNDRTQTNLLEFLVFFNQKVSDIQAIQLSSPPQSSSGGGTSSTLSCSLPVLFAALVEGTDILLKEATMQVETLPTSTFHDTSLTVLEPARQAVTYLEFITRYQSCLTIFRKNEGKRRASFFFSRQPMTLILYYFFSNFPIEMLQVFIKSKSVDLP